MDMKRRDFIAALAGATALPFAVHAQQRARVPTIGFLGSSTRSAQGSWIEAFVQRMRELGWVEGRTVVIEYRWAEGRTERFTEIAAEFVRLKVDVIVTAGAPALAAKQVTSAVPIVFAMGSDPVGSGLVASLARPGATSPAFRSSSLTLRASASNCCVKLSRDYGAWRFCQRRISGSRVGDERGASNGQGAWARCHDIGGPASRGHHPRL